MGVPGFYRWMVQRYPMVRRKMADPSRPIINRLYIDMNGIFYKALAATGTGNEDLTPALKAEIFRYTDMLVQICRPTDLIFIAVDGPAPNAKASQQRSRRYLAARDHSMNSFDRTQISPGTVFMDKLNDALMEFIKDKREKDRTWSRPRVIYSSSFVAGEGEHKILDFIREGRAISDWDPDLVHCLYSTDADLIFLGLQTHEKNILLLREADAANFQKSLSPFEAKTAITNYSFDAFELIHFPLLREYLLLDFGCGIDEIEKVIDDFIAISFLIGNDFIPSFTDIDIRSGDYNDVIDQYRKFRDETKSHIVVDGNFDFQNLKIFLSMVVDKCRQNYGIKNEIPEEELSDKFSEANKSYLESKYPEESQKDYLGLCREMSKSILDAFYWVLRYYNSGCISWTWSYPYLYAPPLEVVIPFIDEYKPEFETGKPNLPFLQQLSIFPPQSAHLMPEPLANLMKAPSPIAKFYPEKFETDLNGKKAEYHAVVVLPILDYAAIQEAYESVISQVDAEDLKRNRLDDPVEFIGLEPKSFKVSTGQTFESVDMTEIAPDCTPTFNTLPYTIEIRNVPVKIFEYPSHNASLVVKINPGKEMKCKDCLPLLNKQILMGYPYLRPALVVGAIDKEEYFDEKGVIKPRPESIDFPAENRQDFLLKSRALEIQITCFLVVKPLVYCTNDGSILDFDTKTELFPTTTMLPITEESIGLRYEEPKAEPFQIGEEVVLVKGEGQGCKATITALYEESADLAVVERSQPSIRKIVDDDNREWTPIGNLLRANNISFKALQHCLSEVNCEGTNIALSLFSANRRQVVDGYAKIVFDESKGRSDIWITHDAARLIPTYFQKAGKLKELMMKAVAEKKDFRLNLNYQDLFPGDDTEFKKEQFIQWLTQNSPAAKAPLVPATNVSLSSSGVAKIEEALTKFKVWTNVTKLEHVLFTSMLRKSGQRPIINGKNLQIGSRIISVAPSGSVPFGTYASVCAIDNQNGTISIVCDEILACGTKLDGKLKTNRGMRLMEREVICL
ncbi:XRN 5'-3' exonuclease N-terminus family protein [Trichomonas vaginalis G3]|uniref:XRN 5'-3' exonuclease N-terminus family protein n=1 Tax=Trichomonas vaginalis (strain ATCC PRA-98 / G3) TaxID=412133 RepID=A2FWN8_TRIV3|nr:5'->3' exoribonuclease family [Trichomonas vaginalis G3]EAX90666.1 XRN 5'-3' exonuclease N-terminus family protein [Trichomonas vaginalis G3]KAI5553994.1 5'->3' exoribonuclease family [Trichomonas vaginalis G3]|eukprot:XP_001303596.1 XRN 5'-3' exonuclease N-terminus family protein [Trichomonas vaginalis G3]